jgi:hypothetical protein
MPLVAKPQWNSIQWVPTLDVPNNTNCLFPAITFDLTDTGVNITDTACHWQLNNGSAEPCSMDSTTRYTTDGHSPYVLFTYTAPPSEAVSYLNMTFSFTCKSLPPPSHNLPFPFLSR